jgi:hypothetical protein
MRPQTQPKHPQPSSPAQIDRSDSALGDLRFRALLTDEDWNSLTPPVRRRFSKRVANGETSVYVGEVRRARFSRLGWLLAQAARLVGGPLPTSADQEVPSIVTVTEDMATGGQMWTRIYTRRRSFPQVIHSAKNFSGPTGLEEYIGCGLSMALTVAVEERALVFRSAGYLLCIGARRLQLPRWLTPGHLTVKHVDLDGEQFMFALSVVHPWAGVLIEQTVVFRETTPSGWASTQTTVQT